MVRNGTSGKQIIISEMNLLQIYGHPSHYKGTIYGLIDKELGGDFVFGIMQTDVKEMDLSVLTHSIRRIQRYSFPFGSYMSGMPSLIREHYDTYLINDEIRDISTWFFLLRKILFNRNKRVFGWGHGMLGKEGLLKRFAYRLFFGMMDGAFIYNERSCQLMRSRGIKTKLYPIYNSLNYGEQLRLRGSMSITHIFRDHFGNDNKNIVFIGRLTKVKRFDLLIDAVAILKNRGVIINITFIGDGIERESMVRMVDEKGLKKNVWFYGACYDEKKNAELIYNADLCVSPGNIGLTAMHVMMFGCPAITNDDFDHQMPEFEAIRDGISGSFFKAGDSYSLADGIDKWFAIHDSDREDVRKACYHEIDSKWNPIYQIATFKRALLGGTR